MKTITKIRKEITEHPSNVQHRKKGYTPLFIASPKSKIIIVGQAPGIRAQESGIVWNDASGITLMKWLGVDEKTFRDPLIFAHLPMDFYYPGKGPAGDLAPRKEFAAMWHPKILAAMPNVQLIIVIGSYAQNYYMKEIKKRNLTETVYHFNEYLPTYFPLVHPSPLNFRWFAKNPWFEKEVVPELQKIVHSLVKIP